MCRSHSMPYSTGFEALSRKNICTLVKPWYNVPRYNVLLPRYNVEKIFPLPVGAHVKQPRYKVIFNVTLKNFCLLRNVVLRFRCICVWPQNVSWPQNIQYAKVTPFANLEVLFPLEPTLSLFIRAHLISNKARNPAVTASLVSSWMAWALGLFLEHINHHNNTHQAPRSHMLKWKRSWEVLLEGDQPSSRVAGGQMSTQPRLLFHSWCT
jgi:hypothetical protein